MAGGYWVAAVCALVHTDTGVPSETHYVFIKMKWNMYSIWQNYLFISLYILYHILYYIILYYIILYYIILYYIILYYIILYYIILYYIIYCNKIVVTEYIFYFILILYFEHNGMSSTNTTPLPVKRKGKGKAIPLQAWTGPDGSRRLMLSDFKTIGTWRW